MLLPEVFPPDIRVEKEAAALLAEGHSVTLFCRGGEDQSRFDHRNGIDIERLSISEMFSGIQGAYGGARYVTTAIHPSWVKAIRNLHSHTPLDALHVHDLPLVKTALSLRDELGIPVIADLHENYPEAARQIHAMRGWKEISQSPMDLIQRVFFAPWRLKRLERYAVQNADFTLTVCEEAREHYLNDCSADPKTVRVIGNTVNKSDFDPDTEGFGASELPFDPDESFVVSYVGNFTQHRGLDTLIEGFSQLVNSEPSAQLLMVGKGNDAYVAGLKDLAQWLGVRDQIHFTGWVDFDKVPKYLATSDVSAVPHASTPHTQTTIPHKLFQSMAMDVPVVVADVAPLKRIVTETESGLISPAGDGTQMGENLCQLTDAEYARTLGMNGLEAITRKYNWERDANHLREIYSQLDTSTEADDFDNSDSPGEKHVQAASID